MNLSSPSAPAPLAVNSRDAAKMLAISQRTLFELTKSGRIRVVRLSDGPKARLLYPVSELEAFLRSEMTPRANEK